MIINGFYFYDYEIKWAIRGIIYFVSFIIFLIGLIHLSKKENRKIKVYEYFFLIVPMLNTIFAVVYVVTFFSVILIIIVEKIKKFIYKKLKLDLLD